VVSESGHEGEWLTLLEVEWGYLMAKARLISDRRKEVRAAREDGGGAVNPFDRWTVKEGA
jgi:hypothetical protein